MGGGGEAGECGDGVNGAKRGRSAMGRGFDSFSDVLWLFSVAYASGTGAVSWENARPGHFASSSSCGLWKTQALVMPIDVHMHPQPSTIGVFIFSIFVMGWGWQLEGYEVAERVRGRRVATTRSAYSRHLGSKTPVMPRDDRRWTAFVMVTSEKRVPEVSCLSSLVNNTWHRRQ